MSENALAMFDKAGLPTTEFANKYIKGMAAVGAKKDGGGDLDGCELMKMNKGDGEWCFGLDGDGIGEDELIVVDVRTLEKGYINWHEGKICGEAMVSLAADLPTLSDLGEPSGDKGWQEQLQFDARFLDEDGDLKLRYKQNSQGGREAIRSICNAVVAQFSEGHEYVFPVISLGNTSYKHSNREYGTIYKPNFTIEFWVNMDGEEQPEGVKKLASDKAEKEEEEDVKEAAPKRRRRKG